MNSPTGTELAAISRMFSPAVLREIGATGRSPLLARLLCETRIPLVLAKDSTLAEVFEAAFSALRVEGNRDDYVYRAAIIQKIVLGRHNLRTATVLTELRAGRSRADVVVLNGTSTAYEIKSERDSLRRLGSQLTDYRSVFARVNVVTSPAQASSVLRVAPPDVGVLVLSSRYRLQVLRESADSPDRTSSTAILASLRTEEAIEVLKSLGIEFPDLPNTRRWGVLYDIFAGLDPIAVHAQAVKVLKDRRSRVELASFVAQMPAPLTAAVLSSEMSARERRNLSEATTQPLSTVLAWG